MCCSRLTQWSRLNKNLSGTPFFVKSYRKFWEHVSAHYDTTHGYSVVLIPIRLSLLILLDTSGCERGFAGYNRIHTDQRPNLEVGTVRNLFAIKHYGPSSSASFNAEKLYEKWAGAIALGDVSSASPKKRRLGAMLRKVMAKAQHKHDASDDHGDDDGAD